MTATRRFWLAVAAAAFSLAILSVVATSADQRPDRGAQTASRGTWTHDLR